MNFRLFLESEERGAWSWDSDDPKGKWYRAGLGHRPTIGAYLDSKRVSIEYAGPFHPLIKKALYALVKQFPQTVDQVIDFDGFKPGTVREFLTSKEYEKRTNSKRLPAYFYHGTSSKAWQLIEKSGLSPRSVTSASPAYGASISSAKPAKENLIYLSASYGAAVRFAASDATRNYSGSYPVILQIDSKGMDANRLRADEDSQADAWQDSIHMLNSVAYEGTIDPRYIKIYASWDSDKKGYQILK
jgi:hypothetical protein